MTGAVVDHLEPVDVQEKHRVQGPRIPSCMGEREVEPVQKERLVRQPGESIVQRGVAELLFHPLALADVLPRRHDADRLARGPLDDVGVEGDGELRAVLPHAEMLADGPGTVHPVGSQGAPEGGGEEDPHVAAEQLLDRPAVHPRHGEVREDQLPARVGDRHPEMHRVQGLAEDRDRMLLIDLPADDGASRLVHVDPPLDLRLHLAHPGPLRKSGARTSPTGPVRLRARPGFFLVPFRHLCNAAHRDSNRMLQTQG